MPATTGDGASATPGPAASRGPKNETLSQLAEERLPELARRAEQAFNENVERVRSQTREAADAATERLEHARTYVVGRVQERPLSTTLTILAAGFVIGVLFAGGRR